MHSLYKEDPGVLPRKILEKLECRKSHIPHLFEAYSLYFYFSLISFLYFFLLFFKIFRLLLNFKSSLFSNQ